MGETEISWTHKPGTVGRTWNPVQGCRRISPGCEHCYAERLAARFAESGWSQGLINLKTKKWNGVARLADHKLSEPLRWRKPSTVFVNSMSDLFYDGFTNEQIAAVFGVMAACPQHTFQVLTKRAKRMREWFEWARREFTMQQRGIASAPHTFRAMLDAAFEELGKPHKPALDSAWHTHEDDVWPLPNVWLGVSVENQEAADERIPELLRTPAAVRFLSCEPLLGPVSLSLPNTWLVGATAGKILRDHGARGPVPAHLQPPPSLDWIITGCESGPGARPCNVEWLRALRDQCAGAGVAYFLKQAVEDSGMRPDDLCDECGERTRYHVAGPRDTLCSCACTVEGPEAADWSPEVGFGDDSKRKTGGVIELPYLDGQQWTQFPEARS